MKKRDDIREIDEYIGRFPAPVRIKLKEIRMTIRKAAPEAVERISYRMPSYFLNGPLVYFAGYAGHIGFYPTSSGIRAFQSELSGYMRGKGSVRFPLDGALPKALIGRITRYRVKENMKKG